jgi:MFS family permease
VKLNHRVILIGFLIQFTTMSFGRFAYTLILPDMMRALGLSTSLMGALGTCIVIGYLVFSLLSGNLAGAVGAARTVKLSVAGATIALVALGTFSRFVPLALAAALLGAGAAGSYIPLISMINNACRAKGSAFGIVMGGTGLGIVLVGYALPPLLGISAAYGYRLSWYALAAVNSVALLAALRLPDDDAVDGGGQDDGEPPAGTSPPDRAGSARPGGGYGKGMNLPLIVTIAVYFMVGFSYIIYVTYFGAYAVDEIGFSTARAGAMWSLFGMNSIYSGILWGFVSDRASKNMTAVLLTSLLALSIFLVIPWHAPLFFFASTFLFGFSFMGFIVLTASLISDHAGRRRMARVFGASTLIHGSGQVIGAFLAGVLKDATGSFITPFLLSCAVLAVGAGLFALLPRPERSKRKQAAEAFGGQGS